jgi:hypothetical protein
LEHITDERPRPHFCFQTIRADSIEEKVAAFCKGSFDPLSTVIVKDEIEIEAGSGQAFPPSIDIRKDTQGRLEYSVNVDRDAVLVIPGNHAPGWRALVDGEEVELFEANILAKGIFVSRGKHEIKLRYLPGSFLWGVSISLSSLLVVLLLFLGARLRFERRSSG